MHAFFGLIRHDLRLAARQGGDIGLVLGFFVLAVMLFPFGVGPEPELLRRIAAGIIWVAPWFVLTSVRSTLYIPPSRCQRKPSPR